MNHERLAELHMMLEEEFKKMPVNHARIAEINHYIAKEIAVPDSMWGNFTLPPDWKTYVTAIIGVLVAANTQFHWVSADLQNALLALAVTLGFWTVQATQATNALHIKKLKAHLTNLMIAHKK